MLNSAATKRFLRLPSVLHMTGIGRTTVYELEGKGRFPRRIKLSSNTTVWLEHEIQSWISDCVAQGRPPSLGGR
jgi:prophage regulatory protein